MKLSDAKKAENPTKGTSSDNSRKWRWKNGHPPRTAKYKSRKVEYDGKIFASKLEKDRYVFLKGAEAEGVISDLRTQVQYVLVPNQYETATKIVRKKEVPYEKLLFRKMTYTADFVYVKDGEEVVEDAKGIELPAFKIKAKLFYFFFQKKIRLVFKPTEEI